MRKILVRLLSVLYFLLIGIVYSQSTAEPVRLRFMTYNIYHGATQKGDFDLDLIASVINEQKPDLVALQEVDLWTNRAHNMDLALELAQRTDMIPLFGKAMSYDAGEYGEAVLSRFSFSRTKNHPLPYTSGKEPRAALQTVVELPTGQKISFIGTHLDHTSQDKNRIMQAKAINKIFKNCEMPTVLAGDLNARPQSEPIRLLEKIWHSSFQNPVPTFPSPDPDRKIDYIMYKPENRWKVVSKKVVDEQVASDHCPVVVDIELLPGKN
ncbi:MAG: endonuclease/exonuclease/phosphatase family protein [Candidatus Marinimicrobia bacterium]|nr:endonuclease/exonuclease/phosphatase family protein [Candidatus Neomarinimicrobiota bacterium]